MTERNDMEELFSSVFEGAELTPPDSVKEAIDAALFTAPAAAKKRGNWWMWSLLVLLVLGGGSALLITSEEVLPEEEVEQIAEETRQISASDDLDANTSAQGAGLATSELQSTGAPNPGAENNRGSGMEEVTRTHGVGGMGISRSANSIARAFTNDQDGSGDNPLMDEDVIPRVEGGESGQGNPVNGISRAAGNPSGSEAAENTALSGQRESSEELAVNSIALRTPILFDGPRAGEALAMAPEARIERTPKQNPWLIAGYAGTSFGMNSVRGLPELTIEEQAGIYASVEAMYSLKPRWMLSGGIDFTQREDRLIQSVTVNDSIFTGNDVVYIYDSTQAIIDSIVTPNYQSTTVQQTAAGRVRYYSIGVPIYLHYQLGLGKKVFLDLSAGIRCSYMNYTNEDPVANIAYPESYKQFGVNVSFRPELLFPINRLQLGLYGRFEYDALHGMQWNALTRIRWSAGFGFSMRYKL